ncbi:hypothetical protein HHL23_05330 [Chryseobacterium sp. RP-3-3]|uniref:Uncharacterized protein n=1 Tax=Chryseobacterium antibioticum TaxID=2728847 RepID=A0A7Y0AKW2_9FLAO|nr:hypothetical protein [Chryseobacterium antibioticum]NML69213.1 hypothetical protein [Chryseobacterium antibioticum]
MEKFARYDFYAQFAFFQIGIAALIFGHFSLFYLIVGIPQLISFITRILLKSKKSLIFIIYGLLILPSWISLLMITGVKPQDYEVSDIFGGILIISLVYSPILASFYLYDTYITDEYYKDQKTSVKETV